MWSQAAVANIKKSLADPNTVFTIPKAPTEKTIIGGASIAAEQSSSNTTQHADHSVSRTDSVSSDIRSLSTGHIILDAGAFITGINIAAYGPHCEYYTIQEVIDELKDEKARFVFNTFPFPIHVKEPQPSSLQYVDKMTKQTGDYFVLSLTDRKVLALTHQIEQQVHGHAHLRENALRPSLTLPGTATASNNTSQQSSHKSTNKSIKRVGAAAAAAAASSVGEAAMNDIPTCSWAHTEQCRPFDLNDLLSAPAPAFDAPLVSCSPVIISTDQPIVTKSSSKKSKRQQQKHILPGFDDNQWISTDNFSSVKQNTLITSTVKIAAPESIAAPSSQIAFGALAAPTTTVTQNIPTPAQQIAQLTTASTKKTTSPAAAEQAAEPSVAAGTASAPAVPKATTSGQTAISTVGCITTDYSMQNTLLQGGMRCLTVEGYSINSIRQYVMGCHACLTLSKDMGRGFCPSCGGYTMVRLTVTVNRKGEPKYHWPMNRINDTRGTIFNIPARKGGKLSKQDLIFSEDMLPKPKLRDVLIARGEKTDPNAQHDLFDQGAYFAFMPQYQQSFVPLGYGRRTINKSRRKHN